MKKYIFLVILLTFFNSLFVAFAQTPSMKSLKREITDLLATQKGTFAVAFKNLTNGNELLINEHENFHAASTMKTPVMIEVYKQAKAGKFSLADSIVIKNEFKSIVDSSVYSLDSSNDSETEIYRHIGEKRTLYQLMYDMIIASSNLATNIIIEHVGAKNVTKTMRTLGAKNILVLRGVEDNKAFDKGLNNTTTAYDLKVIFTKMARGEAVDKKSSEAMIHILFDQTFNTIIPANLPKEVKVAHKTGFISGVHHDSGIIFLPDGRKYVLVILSKELEDEEAAVKVMAHVSEMIYDFLNKKPIY